MGIPDSSIISLNKSRQRAIYYRRVGGNWAQTTLLPADPASINYYLLKGFKAKPPQGESVQEGMIKCPLCEFESKSVFGLQAHLKKHLKKEE